MAREQTEPDQDIANSQLTKEEVINLQKLGYIGPFRAFSTEQAGRYLKAIQSDIIQQKDERECAQYITKFNFRHMDKDVVYDICTNGKIIGSMADVFGPNLLLWESKIWRKPPSGAEVPWHQHYHHLPLSPQISLSAWIALTPATEENGCLEVIPGSHKEVISQVKAPENAVFDKMADPQKFDNSEATKIAMEPGEFILFKEKLLHKSSVNNTNDHRVAVASRVVPPYVEVHGDIFAPENKRFNPSVVISGEDTLGLNQLSTIRREGGPP